MVAAISCDAPATPAVLSAKLGTYKDERCALLETSGTAAKAGVKKFFQQGRNSFRMPIVTNLRRRGSAADEHARWPQGANTQLTDMSGDSLIKTAPNVSRTCDSDEAMREQVSACPTCRSFVQDAN